MILDTIDSPDQVKTLTSSQKKQLASEIRHFLVNHVSHTGGHLASSLGVTELTIALCSVLNLPEDKIVWDVGHQTYAYKVLTGRKDGFRNLRQYGGMSGFPKREESPYDCYNTGHSSTSISAAMGMALARDLRGSKEKIVAVIGDGAMSGGLAYEALNNLTSLKSQMIIIMNDNNMSISESTGGMSQYLAKLRLAEGYNELKYDVKDSLKKVPGGEQLDLMISKAKKGLKQVMLKESLFEDFELTYVGPLDGHNLDSLIEVLKRAVRLNRPIVIHIRTCKGKGYEPAEQNPSLFHGVGPFDAKTGIVSGDGAETYTKVFSKALLGLAAKDQKITAITAAMKDGTGLSAFQKRYPDRFFDVGIAEAHAATFAAGLAVGGLHPVLAVYSSFLQRAYDAIVEDICLQNLPVILAVDRAGLVGQDGPTHHGAFDLSYLCHIPNLTVIAPSDKEEMKLAFSHAHAMNAPVAVRYPRGKVWNSDTDARPPFETGKAFVRKSGSRIAFVALGTMVKTAQEASEILSENGLIPTVVDARFAVPFDEELLLALSETHELIVTMEDNVARGGFGEAVSAFYAKHGKTVRMLILSLPDAFVPQGTIPELMKHIELDAASVAERVMNAIPATEE